VLRSLHMMMVPLGQGHQNWFTFAAGVRMDQQYGSSMVPGTVMRVQATFRERT
jgi:hypothetical protein